MKEAMEKRDSLHLRIPLFLRDALRKEADRTGKSMTMLFTEWAEETVSLYEKEMVPFDYVDTSVRVPRELSNKMRKLAKRDFRTVTGLSAMIIWGHTNKRGAKLCLVDQVEGEQL